MSEGPGHSSTADQVALARSSSSWAQEVRLIRFPFCGVVLGVLCEYAAPRHVWVGGSPAGPPECTMASSPQICWAGLHVRQLVGLAFGQLDQGF